ncbi:MULTISPECIES: FadR/GntR family transcriptional regulator [Bacillaceae]|jgi:DNA-binding FadR family transcriptional regulator|uniref:FadR/GntR family transcriptional regulator n=1 Tax=Niallia hominis TaxID=3133173 RepID=A0ABV1F401_9BACI|nr:MULTISPECIES: FadR/GntR family transcriptional regulator [Bacillaceae]MCF2648269.1 FadR family transcriptional regulator [Niallia circulans]MCM3362079.1 FadR family transcriptional regulator [Niallia sp. MER TA 168]
MNEALYNDIVKTIENSILNGELKVGSKLMSERELATYYQVSRNVVREAIKILKEKGYVQVHVGKGAYVKKPETSVVADTLSRFVDKSLSGIRHILEVREVLEISIIQRASIYATQENIDRLKSVYEEMEQNRFFVDQYVQLDAKFHMELAKSVPNELFYILTKSFSDLSDQVVYLTKINPASIELAQKQHLEMIEAIQTRDEKRAVIVMKQHLNTVKEDIHLLENAGKQVNSTLE